MRLHKSVTSSELLAKGPSAVAMMVASEFWRAREGASFGEEAVRSLWRARELMGVLEVFSLPEAVNQQLLPYYAECRLSVMFAPERLAPVAIETFSARLAEAFDRAAQELAHA